VSDKRADDAVTLVEVPSRDELRAHLVATRIAGDVATSRENNLRNYRRLAERDPGAMFGLSQRRGWTPAEVLDVLARRCGVSPDPSYVEGPDRIDPELTLDALDAMAAALGEAAAAKARVVVATGHPSGVLAVHLEVARALRDAGCTVLTPAAGHAYTESRRDRTFRREIRYLGGVAMISTRGELNHTHAARPMLAVLAALAAADEPPPDLVVADHGWAGAAGEAGIRTVGLADSNDPALFLGQEEGKIEVTVPLDDNVSPHLYAPLTAYVLDRAAI
jgi:hypothetical protein